MDSKKFSISAVIPAFNASKSIERCLESVLRQTFPVFEIIVINDGSTDNTVDVIFDFVEKHHITNLKIINQQNSGVSSARNAGMKAASGNWIALLDSDDEWLPNKLERQIEVLNQNPEIDFIGTGRNGEFLKKIGFKKIGSLTKVTAKQLLIKYVFATPTVLLKKSVLVNQKIQFDSNQSHTEDNKFFIAFCNNNSCYLLNESLVLTGGGKQHIGHSGLSSNITKMEIGELRNLVFAYKNNVINFVELFFLALLSGIRYFRRIFIFKIVPIFAR